MIKQFLVEIDIDKSFTQTEFERMLSDEIEKSDHAWISLKVKDFNPDDWR